MNERFTTIELGIDYGVIDEETGERLFEQSITDKLNELNDKNERLSIIIETKRKQIEFRVDDYNKVVQTIQEAYENERTQLGRSVLKQLLEKIE